MLHEEAIAAGTLEHDSSISMNKNELVPFRRKLDLLSIKRGKRSSVISRVLHFIGSWRRRRRIRKRFPCRRCVEELDRVLRYGHRPIATHVCIDGRKRTDVPGDVDVDRRAESNHATRVTQSCVTGNVAHPDAV